MKLNLKEDSQNVSFGQIGSVLLTDTDVLDGNLTHFVAVTQAVIEYEQRAGDTTIAITIPAGITVYGDITKITITTGDVLAYLAHVPIGYRQVYFNGELLIDKDGNLIIAKT